MLNVLLFLANYVLAMFFVFDIMDLYFSSGINLINNNVNREFVVWVGLVTSSLSAYHFMDKHLFKTYNKEDVIKIVEKSRETGLTAEYLLLTEQNKKK